MFPANFGEMERLLRQAEREFPGDKRKLTKVVLLAMFRGDMTIDAIRRLYVEEMFRPSPNPTAPDGTDLVELMMNVGSGGQPASPPPSPQAQRTTQLYRQARASVQRSGIAVYEKHLPGMIQGKATKNDTIEIEERLTDDLKFYVLVHELAHIAARHLYGNDPTAGRGWTLDHVEYEVDRVAYDIGAAYGSVPEVLQQTIRRYEHLRGLPELEVHVMQIGRSCRTLLGLD